MKHITIKFILQILWQLPQSIIGWGMLLYFMIVGKVVPIYYYKETFVFEASKMRGGISLGTIIIVSPNSNCNSTIRHEFGHVVDSKRFSWLYLIIIGIPSIIWAATYRKLGAKNYYQFYTERRANNNGNTYISFEKCNLYKHFNPIKL